MSPTHTCGYAGNSLFPTVLRGNTGNTCIGCRYLLKYRHCLRWQYFLRYWDLLYKKGFHARFGPSVYMQFLNNTFSKHCVIRQTASWNRQNWLRKNFRKPLHRVLATVMPGTVSCTGNTLPSVFWVGSQKKNGQTLNNEHAIYGAKEGVV